MGLVLDTSILIAAEREEINLASLAKEGNSYIATISVTELLVGAYSSKNKAKQHKRFRFINFITNDFVILPLTLDITRKHAQIIVELRAKGQMIGAYDTIIAATALAYGHKIATHDMKDFKRISGLEIINL